MSHPRGRPGRKSDPPTRIANSPVNVGSVGAIGEEEEVTRALDRPLVEEDVHPADAEGPTRMVADVEARAPLSEEEEESPADGEKPTLMLADGGTLPGPSSPADTEDRTLQRPQIQSEPPPAEKTRALPRSALIGEEDVPVTEGTALLPQTFVMRVRAAQAEAEGRPPPTEGKSEKVVIAPSVPPPALVPEPELHVDIDMPPTPAPRGGWSVAVILFIITFVLTGGALLLAWRAYMP